jgi:hypothetical protein
MDPMGLWTAKSIHHKRSNTRRLQGSPIYTKKLKSSPELEVPSSKYIIIKNKTRPKTLAIMRERDSYRKITAYSPLDTPGLRAWWGIICNDALDNLTFAL